MNEARPNLDSKRLECGDLSAAFGCGAKEFIARLSMGAKAVLKTPQSKRFASYLPVRTFQSGL